MPEATSGTLLTCDGPAIKQFVLKLDEERRGSMADSFILRDLDDSHLLIRDDPEVLTFIHKRLDDLQARAGPAARMCVLDCTRARPIVPVFGRLDEPPVHLTARAPLLSRTPTRTRASKLTCSLHRRRRAGRRSRRAERTTVEGGRASISLWMRVAGRE